MKLTPEQLDVIEQGCEGVTPGPWEAQKVAGDWREDEWGEADWFVHMEGDCDSSCMDATHAAHVARLDPDTVRELVRGYREALREVPE